MKRIAILALAAGFGLPAFAASETYVIDTGHTKPRFEYSHFGYSTQSSRFDTVSGKITSTAQPRPARPTSALM